MTRVRLLFVVCVAVLSLCATALAQSAPAPVRVVVRTELGDIEVEIDAVHAPVTAANLDASKPTAVSRAMLSWPRRNSVRNSP